MELLAAIKGLQALTEACKVKVITDSLYLQQGMTMYLRRWRRHNWLSSRGSAIANRDLWEQLITAAERHETAWCWVRGHGSDPDQDRCDVLAQASARSVPIRRPLRDCVA
jgi:ribonuclease HI